ncbi:hypothetical protein L3X38_012132 [Prunus dulcis]|uniref:Uncharacterized protein n=1 Tax=Prunus dulcis TaxID=3755 RepID=A0AAD4WIR0_PRUDU|nr:hypothetical protein L3X38_012132 [Prunus dulcis]
MSVVTHHSASLNLIATSISFNIRRERSTSHETLRLEIADHTAEEGVRKATSTVTIDPKDEGSIMTAVDLETVGTIAGADPLKSPYQGNHQKRRCTKE